MEGIFKDLTKFLTRVVILTILVLVLGSILDISFEPWVKIVIPKPSIKIEDNVSRETPVKTTYEVDGKEVTADEYFKWAEKELDKASKKPPVKDKGLKFTRTTTKGNIIYGNER